MTKCSFLCIILSIRASLSQGLGTDEDTLTEILASRNNREILDIKKVYKEGLLPFWATMSSFIKLVFGNRSDTTCDSGENYSLWDTCFSTFLTWSYILDCDSFHQEYKSDLEEDIGSDTSGDFKAALIALCKVHAGTCLPFVSWWAFDPGSLQDFEGTFSTGTYSQHQDALTLGDNIMLPAVAAAVFINQMPSHLTKYTHTKTTQVNNWAFYVFIFVHLTWANTQYKVNRINILYI